MKRFIQRLKVRTINLLLVSPAFQFYMGKKWYKRWEQKYVPAEFELTLFPKLIHPGAIIFDIGANRGEVSYFLAVECGAKTVYSFEPQKRMFGVLKGSMDALLNVVPVRIALSDKPGNAKLTIPVRNHTQYTQQASLEEVGESGNKESVVVDTLDAFVKRHSVSQIDFIKCDTEGHELSVFLGAKESLAKFRPMLMVEVGSAKRAAFFEFMSAQKYRAYALEKGVRKLVVATPDKEYDSANYFFVPVEKPLELESLC